MRYAVLACLMAVAAFIGLSGPAWAAEPSGDDCYGTTVEFECYEKSTGRKCGSMMGTSCYSSRHDSCSADAGYGCNKVCVFKNWCNDTFTDCCQGNCAGWFKYSKDGWDFSNACPHDFKP